VLLKTNMFQKLKNLLQFDLFLMTRFLACILVIRQHANFSYPSLNLFGNNFGWLIGGNNSSGGYAVVVFFVISGYLMSKVFLTNRYDFTLKGVLKFWIARIKRIAPLYYIINTVGLWFLFYYLLTPGWQNLKRLVQLLFFTYDQSYIFNQVSWTITLEMIYYLICPLVICLIYRFRANIAFIFVFTLVSFALILYPVHFTEFSLVNSFLGNIGYFLLGSILYPITEAISKNLNSKLKYASFISFIAVILGIMFPWSDYPGWNSGLVLAILTSIFIVVRETNDIYEISSKFGNILDQLGFLSYSIYLVHMLILIRFNDIYRVLLDNRFGQTKGGLITFMLVSLISISVSYLLIKIDKLLGIWIEKILKKLFKLV
jgi:peptidoglycan/LPS O-acetylase OafA/YrhL